MAPSLKFLVVSEVTCHRRKNQTNQSSLPRTNTDSLLHKQETSQVTTKYYYICENYFVVEYQNMSSEMSKFKHPPPNISSCYNTRGSQADIIPLAKLVTGRLFWRLKVRYVQQRVASCPIHAVLPKLEFADTWSNIFWIQCLLT